MPKLKSVEVRTFSFAIGAQKLGHPVPESNLVSELNNALSQQMQRYSPLSWISYWPLNALSVPCWRVTWNCKGVSCCLHSASVLCTFLTRAGPSFCPESLN